MSVLRELGLFDHADARVGSTHGPVLLSSRNLCAHPLEAHISVFLLRTRPSRPKFSSSKPALLLVLLSISGGNEFASVATLSANPALMALKLPAKGSQSLMGQLDSHPEWWDTLCAVEHKAPPPFTSQVGVHPYEGDS